MRRFTRFLLIAVLVGCGGSADQANPPADSAAMAPSAPAGISLADVAGNWNMEVRPENSDSVVLKYQLTATGETTGWSFKLPDRADPIPLHVVSVAGDSIMIHADPYPSALRKGSTVETTGVFRLLNGMIVGTTTAKYRPATADSVMVLRIAGTRAQ
jgi:hypothetical protein